MIASPVPNAPPLFTQPVPDTELVFIETMAWRKVQSVAPPASLPVNTLIVAARPARGVEPNASASARVSGRGETRTPQRAKMNGEVCMCDPRDDRFEPNRYRTPHGRATCKGGRARAIAIINAQ